MAMAPSLQKTLTVLLLLLASTSTLVMVRSAEGAPPPAPSSAVYHMDLIHVDAHGNFTSDELIRRAQHRSHARAAALSAASSSRPAAAADGKTYLETASYSGEDLSGEYLVNLSIGTPERPFLAVADTGSDETWTRKMTLCSSTSSSFDNCSSGEQCVFKKVYGSQKLTAEGFKADENLTLSSWCHRGFRIFSSSHCWWAGKKQVIRMPLGCAYSCADCNKLIPKDADGVVGLNHSPRSLLSLLRKELGVTKFSYCLSNRLKPEQRSRLWFGGAGLRLPAADVQSTSLVSIKAEEKSVSAYRYYVELEGVSIAGKDFKEVPGVSFNHRSEGGKGAMFVDSGCSFSELESAAFNEMKNLLVKELGNPETVDDKKWAHCFKLSSSQIRDAEKNTVLILHLNGANMSLPWSSYMTTTKDGHSCLTISDHGQEISILGNFQTQNIHMLFDLHDLEKKKLFFVPVEDCSKQEMK